LKVSGSRPRLAGSGSTRLPCSSLQAAQANRLGGTATSTYHSDRERALSNKTGPRKKPSRAARLRRLADGVLEAGDLESLARLLARELPKAAGVASASLLFWDRKLEAFNALIPGDTQARPLLPQAEAVVEQRARYLISDGALVETPGATGEATLVPLMARSGLVGMIVLGPRRRAAGAFEPGDVRRLSDLAKRTALAIENQLYQSELIASERMAALGTMAGMLAHDFRGPMTVIRGYAETLMDGAPAEAEIRERAQLITKMIDRLERMTSETLDFARGSHTLVRRPMPLPTLLAELAEGIAAESPGLTVERHFDVPSHLLAGFDLDKLRRALGNIAANARDAMGGKGRVHLEARVADERLVLELADEGKGVPPEIRERVFEPFVTHGKKGGTGLGLAVARRFVEDHGGTIELLPEGPGARFRISLPLSNTAAPPPGSGI
jgi:signal transduction histidine kinase